MELEKKWKIINSVKVTLLIVSGVTSVTLWGLGMSPHSTLLCGMGAAGIFILMPFLLYLSLHVLDNMERKERCKQIIADEENERKYPVERLCHQCGEVTVIYVREADYNKRIKERTPAQDCFPYLTMPERETIISGMCSECQKKLFPLNYDKNGNWVGIH